MSENVFESDRLRQPQQACAPDARQRLYVRLDRKTGATRERTINDQHEVISRFTLNASVPEDIAVHFETARNLYLYAWFVYRFYSVAEQQVLASLEFSLRERFPEFVAEEKKKHRRGIEPGLGSLLKHAINTEAISNRDLSIRELLGRRMAEARYKRETREKMMKAGIDSWIEDESEIVVTEEDLSFDWLGRFHEIIPTIRNAHAHGSPLLNPSSVSDTFEMVVEIINQLYPRD